jgi:hypothetical protein
MAEILLRIGHGISLLHYVLFVPRFLLSFDTTHPELLSASLNKQNFAVVVPGYKTVWKVASALLAIDVGTVTDKQAQINCSKLVARNASV